MWPNLPTRSFVRGHFVKRCYSLHRRLPVGDFSLQNAVKSEARSADIDAISGGAAEACYGADPKARAKLPE
jgi:hypothetical protein